jgi:hypothetical protein
VEATEGKLDFGPWEQIFYGEFDGRRKKRVVVKIIGNKKVGHLDRLAFTLPPLSRPLG